jgi:hypothetical protein
VTVFSKSRRNRRIRATARPVPEPPTFTPAPSGRDTDGYPYLPSTLETLRQRAEWCRAQADDLDTQASDCLAWAVRRREEASDFDRLGRLAEQDRAADVLTPADGPAMGIDELASPASCPCGCTPISCLYCDAECACGRDCPNCKRLPRLGAGAAPPPPQAGMVHFDDGDGYYPPCAAGDPLVRTTGEPVEVTCPSCAAALADRASAPWTPTSEAATAGWDDDLPPVATADTQTLHTVDGSAR